MTKKGKTTCFPHLFILNFLNVGTKTILLFTKFHKFLIKLDVVNQRDVMKKITQLFFLSFVFFSSYCCAMDKFELTDEELCAYFDKLIISSTQTLQLQVEPDSQSSSSQEDFTQATPWQTQSFLDLELEKENIPPSQSLNTRMVSKPAQSSKKNEKPTQENHIQRAAQMVEDYLATHQKKPIKSHPLYTRCTTFYISLEED